MNLFGNRTPNNKKRERYLHNLCKGDHVVRWDRIVVYPIQVHGIVLSASDDVVTIVDFGLTAAPVKEEEKYRQEGKLFEVKINTQGGNGGGIDNDIRIDSTTPLEEMINHEDRAMIKTCESHRHEIMGPDRINILVLTEEKDIKLWKKVNYAVEKKKKGKFQWWWDNNNDDNDNDNKKAGENREEKEVDQKDKDTYDENIKIGTSTAMLESKQSDDVIRENCSYEFSEINGNEDVTAAAIAIPTLEKEIQTNRVEDSTSTSSSSSSSTEDQERKDSSECDCSNKEGKDHIITIPKHNVTKAKTAKNCPTTNNKNNNKELPEPLLTRSDPTTIVLARVRYLVSNPHVLPPHHIFYSNSECIAVWCKTGVWSTLQASIYLHSTAAGNFKSAVTAAAAVGGSTVTTTVPASGIGGWFGLTTTTTVSLVSVQPWIIPALAGYGIIAVGGPYIVLRKCHEQWRRSTTELNDKFWGELDADVYVEAIKSWSGLD